MDTKPPTAPTPRSGYRRRIARTALAACLAASLTVRSPDAAAQWIVNDPAAIVTAITEHIREAARWIETAKHYAETVQHYAQTTKHFLQQVEFWKEQLVKLKGLKLELFKSEYEFKRIAEDFGVAETCQGATGGSLDIKSILSALASDLSGDIVSQQKEVCVAIVKAKNLKYNMTVDYFDFVKKSTADLVDVHTTRLDKVTQSLADLNSVLTDTQRYSSNLENARAQWETNMKQQETIIAMLTQKQSILSRRAMNGKPSVWGTLVNTLTLQAALKL